jgi:hypothetical protein
MTAASIPIMHYKRLIMNMQPMRGDILILN